VPSFHREKIREEEWGMYLREKRRGRERWGRK
jgi:hypothetical protein